MSDGGGGWGYLVLLPTRNLHLVVGSRLLRNATLLEEAVLDFLLLLDTISIVSTHSFIEELSFNWGTYRSQHPQKQPLRQLTGKSPVRPKRSMIVRRWSTIPTAVAAQHPLAHHPRQEALTGL